MFSNSVSVTFLNICCRCSRNCLAADVGHCRRKEVIIFSLICHFLREVVSSELDQSCRGPHLGQTLTDQSQGVLTYIFLTKSSQKESEFVSDKKGYNVPLFYCRPVTGQRPELLRQIPQSQYLLLRALCDKSDHAEVSQTVSETVFSSR